MTAYDQLFAICPLDLNVTQPGTSLAVSAAMDNLENKEVYHCSFEYEISLICEFRKYFKTKFTEEFLKINKNCNWRCFVHYIPASVTFIPWDLGWLGYRKDKLITNDEDFIHHRSYSAEDLQLIDTELTIRFWKKVPFENCLYSLKLKLVKCVDCAHCVQHENCSGLSIGIYKTHKSTAGNVIWMSLRETQHLITALIEFVELVKQTLENKDWNEWHELTSDLKHTRVVSTNKRSRVTPFTPVNLHNYNIVKDSHNGTEPTLDSEEVTKQKSRNIDKRLFSFMWKRINSLQIAPFAPSLEGPYFLKIYKAFGLHPFNLIYISVFEVQHLIIKLILLMAEGVECIVNKTSPIQSELIEASV